MTLAGAFDEKTRPASPAMRAFHELPPFDGKKNCCSSASENISEVR